MEAFDVSALPVISASAQSDRLRHERFHRAGAGGTARLADRGSRGPGPLGAQAGGADRMVHAGARDPAHRAAARTGWCMLALAILPIALRLAMLAQSPAPTPNGSDDFSHLLVADTLRHFRLANPPHPLHQFFETI